MERTKPRKHGAMRHSWPGWALLSALVLLAAPLLLCWGVYLWGASALPADLAPSGYRAPAAVARQYRQAEANGISATPRLDPVSYLWALHRSQHDPEIQAQLRLLSTASRWVSQRDSRPVWGLRRHAANGVRTIRISRDWSLDEVIGTVLGESWYGRGATGIEAAARAYYGQPLAQLLPEESLALIALLRAPRHYDPHCHRERFQARFRLLAQRLRLPPEDALRAATLRLLPTTCTLPPS